MGELLFVVVFVPFHVGQLLSLPLLYSRVSSILSDAAAPIRLVTQFIAQILVFDVKIPMTKGDTVCLFLSLRFSVVFS